jgi:hypothetical protein
MRNLKKPRAFLRWPLAFVAMAPFAICAAVARAEAISYSLMFCESLDVLRDPDNKTLAMNAAWKPQHSLMLERTMPYFELRNTSEEATITQLMITIGDMSKSFDWAQLIESSPAVMFSLIDLDGSWAGQKSDTLVINFSGLGPGEFVRFRTGLAPDDGPPGTVLDYRMTLFHLNGSDPSSNSLVTVNFQGAEGTQSLAKQLPNYTSMGMATSTTLAFPNHYMDMVMPFSLTDEGTIGDEEPGPEVPEPETLVLLASGLLGLAAWRARRWPLPRIFRCQD